MNIISDGVLIYWLYYYEASSGSGQSGKSSTSSAPAIVDIFLEVLEMKVRATVNCTSKNLLRWLPLDSVFTHYFVRLLSNVVYLTTAELLHV